MTEPKINVDEDWKSQVQREKEKAIQNSSSAEDMPEEDLSDDEMAHYPPPPPANFAVLVSSLATYAVAALGQLEQPTVRLDYAKHYIDLLEVIQEKTRRNLTGEEHDMLQGTLHQLRLLYVSVEKQQAVKNQAKSSAQEKPASPIIMP